VAGISHGQSVAAVTTPLGSDLLVLDTFSGREALSELFRFKLDMYADNERSVPFDQLVGQPLTLDLTLPTGGTRSFNGIVSRFSQGARVARTTTYRAELVPSLWLLTRTQQSRVFAQRSVPDILLEVLAGFGDVETRLIGQYQARNYCVQYRESDFSFVSRLMEEEGIFYFFKHTSTGHTLVLGDSPAALSDIPGARVVTFDASGTGKDAAQSIFSWEKTQDLRAGKVTLRDHNFQLPDNSLEGQATIRESVRAGQVTHNLRVGGNERLEIYDYPGGYAKRFDGVGPGGGDQPGELQRIFAAAAQTAAIRMDEEALPSVVIEGGSNARGLTSGHRFALAQHFNGDGEYVITSVDHSARVRDPKGGERGMQYENRFTCIPQGLPFRPARLTERPAIGTQTAVVVGPAGEEIFTDKYGRVKVQFYWDREGKKDENSSCWVRVAQPVSGSGGGVSWRPEIGDEVVVAFEEGDPDRPIVIGSVYNPRHLPPPLPPR